MLAHAPHIEKVKAKSVSPAERAARQLARVELFLTSAYAQACDAARAEISLDDLEAVIAEASSGAGLLKADAETPEIAWNEAQSLDLRVLGQPYAVVRCNVEEFDSAWRDGGAEYVGPAAADDGPALTEAVARSARAGVFLPPPVVADLSGRGRWAFLNGRNRYLYTRAAGHRTIPLAVPQADAQRLRNAAGVGGSLPSAAAREGVFPVGALSRPYADLSDAIAHVGATLANRFFSAVMASAIAVGEREAISLARLLDARGRAAKLDTALDFETPNYGALAELQLSAMGLIVEMTAEQREVILSALRDGVERGINPREMARTFRASIGLTRTQEGYIEAYRRALQTAHLDPKARANALGRALHDNRFNANLTRAASGQPISAEKIEQMVARYRARFIAYRAETIARTQALRAVQMAEEAVWQEAVRRGDIVAAEVEETWDTARDERVRNSHKVMHGQKRQMGQPFLSGLGNLLRFPGDPLAPPADTVQCRCVKLRQLSAEPLVGANAGGVRITGIDVETN